MTLMQKDTEQLASNSGLGVNRGGERKGKSTKRKKGRKLGRNTVSKAKEKET